MNPYEDHWLARRRERSTVPSLPDIFGGTQLAYESKVRELCKSQDGELERMLVAHVALCWVHFQETVKRYNTYVMTAESFAIQPALYWERRLSATQRRYLLAVGMLARVRRLAKPVMQINFAERQVNIAGGGLES